MAIVGEDVRAEIFDDAARVVADLALSEPVFSERTSNERGVDACLRDRGGLNQWEKRGSYSAKV